MTVPGIMLVAHLLGGAPMAVRSKQERVLQVVLVVLGLGTVGASAYRSLIAYAVWSSFAHTAVMALMALQLPTKRGELLAGVAVTGLSAVLLFVVARSAYLKAPR